MSSYSEFKSDVKGLTIGIIFVLILGALIQLSVVLIILGLSLLIIPIARLLGVSSDKIQALKTGIVLGVGMGVILSFLILAFSTIYNAPAFQEQKPLTEQQRKELGELWDSQYK
jgi:hypothetical protein